MKVAIVWVIVIAVLAAGAGFGTSLLTMPYGVKGEKPNNNNNNNV